MKNKKTIYGLLCGLGGILIGYFGGKLNTIPGCILFVLGILLIIGSSLKMGE